MTMKLLANLQGFLNVYSSTATQLGSLSNAIQNSSALLMVEEVPEQSESRETSLNVSHDALDFAPLNKGIDIECLNAMVQAETFVPESVCQINESPGTKNRLVANDEQQPCSSTYPDQIEEGTEASCVTFNCNTSGFIGESEKLPERLCRNKKFVRFPKDTELVSQWVEPVKPLFMQRRQSAEASQATNSLNVHEIVQAYLNACKKYKVQHNPRIEKQISCFHLAETERQEVLSLRGDKVNSAQMDCLEEIFKRVQFTHLDFEYCFLDDEAVVTLCDMLEFYDSALRLNLSFNQNITLRGWQALCRMLKKSPCLEQLNLRYTSLNERSIPLLSRTLKFPDLSLTSLHLENCSLSGKSMLLLACAMKSNASIRDLHLADNNLLHTDAAHLYQIIIHNSTLELLDLRNNSVQDPGLAHICDALRHPDCQSHSKLNTLVLWNNSITAKGMIHMIRVLMENKTLRTLNMGRSDICGEGVALIKEALARNTTLLQLGLQSTKLNCQGAIAIAESIADNVSLIRVDLRANPDIKSAGLLALHVAMRLNRTITSLNLDKTCALLAPAQSKQHKNNHVEHFRKLFDEIASFCRRNYEDYVKRLMSQRDEEYDLGTENCDQNLNDSCQAVMIIRKNMAEEVNEAQECILEDRKPVFSDVAGTVTDSSDKMMTLDQSPDVVDESDQQVDTFEELVPTNVEYFYDYYNPSKKCIRKVSLTCQELVDNLRERFEAMPRFQETVDHDTEEGDSSQCEGCVSSASHSSIVSVDDQRKPRPRPTTPIAIGTPSLSNNTQEKPVSLSMPIIGSTFSSNQTASPRRVASSRFSIVKVVKPMNDGQQVVSKWTELGNQGLKMNDSFDGTNVRRISVEDVIKKAESVTGRPVKVQEIGRSISSPDSAVERLLNDTGDVNSDSSWAEKTFEKPSCTELNRSSYTLTSDVGSTESILAFHEGFAERKHSKVLHSSKQRLANEYNLFAKRSFERNFSPRSQSSSNRQVSQAVLHSDEKVPAVQKSSCKDTAGDIEMGVRGALRDILTYCDYATSQSDLTQIYTNMTSLPSPVTSRQFVDDTESIASLLHDLVHYVDYETKSIYNFQIPTGSFQAVITLEPDLRKRLGRAKSERVTSCVDRLDDSEIYLAVARTVRALIKKVSLTVDKKTSAKPSDFRSKLLSKFSACRSSVALRKKALQKR